MARSAIVWWRTIAAAMILLVFPAVTMWVNFTGLGISRGVSRELKDSLGIFRNVELTNTLGESVTDATLRGKVILATFVSANNAANRDSVAIATLKPVLKHYEETTNNLYMMVIGANAIDSLKTMTDYAAQMGIRNMNRWQFVTGKTDEVARLMNGIKYPTTPTADANPYIVLMDTAGIVRRVYDTRIAAQRKRLVEHLFILPINLKGKAEVRTDKK